MRGIGRWLSIAIVLALLALQALSLPFYAGSSLGPRLAWRLEHGRLTVKFHPPQSGESPYVAINSEGLRWGWEASFANFGQWVVCVPLWVPLIGASAWAVWSWRKGVGSRRGDPISSARALP